MMLCYSIRANLEYFQKLFCQNILARSHEKFDCQKIQLGYILLSEKTTFLLCAYFSINKEFFSLELSKTYSFKVHKCAIFPLEIAL